MSYVEENNADLAALEQFAWEERMGADYEVEPRTIIETDQKRILRDKKGRFKAVYGDVYAYDETRNIFVPSWLTSDCAVKYVVDYLPTKAPAPEPVGYHNLTMDDL